MLETTIGNIHLKTCIYNASGPKCTYFNELSKLNSSPYTSLVLTKSCTYQMRKGNENPRYYQSNNKDLTINSTGLANLGYQEYINYAESFKSKPYFVSVSGLSLEDNIKMITKIGDYDTVKGIELNLSCPNVIGKPQIGYDFNALENTLRCIFEKYDNEKQIFGIKLPPYFDMIHYQTVADIILQFPRIQFLTCINSLGNGLVIEPFEEKVVIKPKNGFGGIGGKIVKPIALANVHQFYKLLGNKVDIIGCGGIDNGTDAFEHILCGAKAVQIGSKYMIKDVECFKKISHELEEVMIRKGYKTIEDFRGKLKYL